ncbi:MAG: hypothetical protein ACHQNT_01380, partial [Bacteroidia bacterium]
MRTPVIKKISSLALACAMLFGISAANAQDAGKEKEKNKDEKKKLTRIVIIKDEDGKTVKTDTSIVGDFHFDSDDFNFNFDFEMPDLAELPMPPTPPYPPGGFYFHYEDDENLTPEEKAKHKEEKEKMKAEWKRANEEMKHFNNDEFKKEMEELKKQMKELRIEIQREKEKGNDKAPGEKGDKKLMMYRIPADGNSETTPSIARCMIINDGDTLLANCMKKCIVKCPKDSLCLQKSIKWVYDDKEQASTELRKIKRKIMVIEKEEPQVEEETPAEKTESPVAEIKNERKASEPNLSQLQAEDLKFFPNPSDGNFSLEF